MDFSAANVDRLFRLCYSDTERLEKSYIRQQSQLFFMGVSGWFSIRGCIWASRSKDVRRRHFHLAVLLLIVMEYCLWTASCFWVSDTLANPYFWFDFGLSGSAVLLLIAAERAVGK